MFKRRLAKVKNIRKKDGIHLRLPFHVRNGTIFSHCESESFNVAFVPVYPISQMCPLPFKKTAPRKS